MAKKVKTSKAPRLTIDWIKITKDKELIDAIALLCAMVVKQDWRPCVRAQVFNALGAITTLLIAMDGEYQHTLKLLDKDAGTSVSGQLVKPVKRKKVARRR